MSRAASRATWRPVLLLAACCAGATGCESVLPRATRLDATAGMFQSAKIIYRVDTGALSEAVNASRIQGRHVSFQPQPSSPFPKDSIARMSVQYPHPDGRSDFALAEVVIHSRQPLSAADPNAGQSTIKRWADGLGRFMQDTLPGVKYNNGVYEAWAFDMPKADLDRAVGQLADTGFYHMPPNPAPGVDISTQLDHRPMHKQWKRVPQLDVLMQRVREEGKLVSYTQPLDFLQPPRFGPRRPRPALPPNAMIARSGSPYTLPLGQQSPPVGPPRGAGAMSPTWPNGRQSQFGGPFANRTAVNPFAPQQGILPTTGDAAQPPPEWLAQRATAPLAQPYGSQMSNWRGNLRSPTWPASHVSAPPAGGFTAQGSATPAVPQPSTNAAPGARQFSNPYGLATSATATPQQNPLASPTAPIASPASFQQATAQPSTTASSPFAPATPAAPSPLSDLDSEAKSTKTSSSDSEGFFSNLGSKLQKFKSW